MAEVLTEFDRAVAAPDGTLYHAQAAVYLEGALVRTLEPGPVVPARKASVESNFDGPAPSGTLPPDHETPTVLNPFSVYRKGEAQLRSQLAALSPRHLVNIVRGYELSDAAPAVLERTAHPDLIELIVAAVALRAEDH